jgi:hypothetical protein
VKATFKFLSHMRTAPCQQKGLITENRARGNSSRSPSCLRCWGQTRSSSRNATESVNRQPIRDIQTPRLKGMAKLSHTISVESVFLTYTTYLKRPGKCSANVAYSDILMWRTCLCLCVSVYVCVCVCVCMYACFPACTHARLNACTYLCVCVYVWMCVFVRTCLF